MTRSSKPLATPPSSTHFNPENDPVHRYALVSPYNVDERFVRVPNLNYLFATHKSAVDYRFPDAAAQVGLRLLHDHPECICPPDELGFYRGDEVGLSDGGIIKVYDAFNYAIILNGFNTPHALSCWTCLHDNLNCTLSTWYRGRAGAGVGGGDGPRLVDDQGREMAIAGKCVGCVQTGEECHLEGIDLLSLDEIVAPEVVPIRYLRDGVEWRVSRLERSLDLTFVCSDFLQVSKSTLSDANRQIIAELREEADRFKHEVLALPSEDSQEVGRVMKKKRHMPHLKDVIEEDKPCKFQRLEGSTQPFDQDEPNVTLSELKDAAKETPERAPSGQPYLVESSWWFENSLTPLSELSELPCSLPWSPEGCSYLRLPRKETLESSKEPPEVPRRGLETKTNTPPFPSPVSSNEPTTRQQPSTSQSGATSQTGQSTIEQALSDAQSALARVADVYARQDQELTDLRSKLEQTQHLLANSVAESERRFNSLQRAKTAWFDKQIKCSRLIEERDTAQARAEGLQVDSEKLRDEVRRLTEQLARADETIEVYTSEIEEVNRRRIAELDRRKTVDT